MNKNELFEVNYSASLLELQHSLNHYLETIEKLINAIEASENLTESKKTTAKKTTVSTITTLLEVQKIIYKKINLLTKHWEVELPTTFHSSMEQFVSSFKVRPEIIDNKIPLKNMKKYHFKKSYHYSIVINYESCNPAPIWTNHRNIHYNSNL